MFLGGAAIASACGSGDGAADAAPPTTEGPATILARGQGAPAAVAVDDRGVFWVNYGGGEVMHLPPGAAAPIALAEGLDAPRDLCLAEAAVYVATEGLQGLDPSPGVPGGLFAAAVDGGGVAEIYRPDYFGPSDVDCAGGEVFWTQPWADRTDAVPEGLFSGLMRLGDSAAEFLINEAATGPDIALDGTFVYWHVGADMLVRTPRDSPTSYEVVVSDADPSDGIATRGLEIDRDELFWIVPPRDSGQTAALLAAPASGGTPRQVAELVEQGTPQWSLAVDATHVYWTEIDQGRVMRVARSGGAPEVVADGQDSPTGIALYEGAAFWGNTGSGNVVTVALSRLGLGVGL